MQRIVPQPSKSRSRPADSIFADHSALEDDVEALLAEWSVSPGDAVTAGQQIGVVEVVKASVAIVAPVAGHIGALCVPAGTTFGRDAVLALVRLD